MIFQYIQFQLNPFKIWLQYIILQKGKQPDKKIFEIDLQTESLKTQIISIITFLIDKYQIQNFKRLFIHCGTGDFFFIDNNKQTEPISLEQLNSNKVAILKDITSILIKLKKPDFDDTDLFYSKFWLMSVKEYKKFKKEKGIILTDKEAKKDFDKAKIKLDKFIKKRPDLRRLKEK